MLMTESPDIKKLSRSLQDKTNSLKKWVEELAKEVDVILDLVKEKEEKIQVLETESQNLSKINEDLRIKMMFLFQKQQEKDTRRKSILKNPKADFVPEKDTTYQSRDTENKVEKDKEPQRSTWQNMADKVIKLVSQMLKSPVQKERIETEDALLEGEEKEAMEEMLLRSKKDKVLHCFWEPFKLWLAGVLCFGLFICLLLVYAYFFNHAFIANMVSLLLNDSCITELAEFLSPFLTWKNNGLLPF